MHAQIILARALCLDPAQLDIENSNVSLEIRIAYWLVKFKVGEKAKLSVVRFF